MSAQDTNPIIPPTEVTTEAMPDVPASPMQALTSLTPFLLVFIVIYFLIIRPQDKKRRVQEELVSGVKKGEEVITLSGIYGTVSRVNDIDGTIELIIAENVTIKISKSAIADIISRKSVQKTSAAIEPEQKKKPEKKKK